MASSEVEASLGVMATHIQSLHTSTDRLRARVREPFDKIEAGTTSLARLQETADILRRVIRILQLSKRLAGSMAGGETDVGKAAQGLAELSDLLQEDLTGLEVVEGEARRARQWRAEVERQGEQLLARGLETGNQASTGTGLQVFYNLGSLPAVVAGLLDSLHSEVRQAWTEGLDIKSISERGEQGGEARGRTPGRANLPSGNMAAFRATLWSNLDSLLEGLHAHVVKVYHLQRLLCKKVDPLTHQAYISVLDHPALVSTSWSRLTDIVRTSLADAVIKSNFVKQTLEAEYPKLVKLYSEVWSKLRYSSSQYGPGPGQLLEGEATLGDPFLQEQLGPGLRDTLASLEQAYLARSLSRLFDPVNLMYSGSGAPGKEEVPATSSEEL